MRLTSLLPRFRLLTLLLLTAFAGLGLVLLPLEEWRDARSIKELSKGPFGVTCKWEQPKGGLAAFLPWKKRVTVVVIDNWEPASGQTQIPSESLLPLQRLSSLDVLSFSDYGSDYPMPPIPKLPHLKELELICNLDFETTRSLGQNLPNLQSIYVAPGAYPEDSSGMFASMLPLPHLKRFDCWELRLSVSDVHLLQESQIEHVIVRDGEISDEVLAEFSKLRTLKTLFVWSNQLTDNCLDGIAQLKNSPTLQEITIMMPFSSETQNRIDQKKLLDVRKGQTLSIEATSATQGGHSR